MTPLRRDVMEWARNRWDQHKAYYNLMFKDEGMGDHVVPVDNWNNSDQFYHVDVRDGDRFVTEMKAEGIECNHIGCGIVQIPCGWWVTSDERQRICQRAIEIGSNL